jgi:hypothetical protein
VSEQGACVWPLILLFTLSRATPNRDPSDQNNLCHGEQVLYTTIAVISFLSFFFFLNSWGPARSSTERIGKLTDSSRLETATTIHSPLERVGREVDNDATGFVAGNHHGWLFTWVTAID